MSTEQANYQRGEYLLERYRTYRQCAGKDALPLQTCLAVLRILAYGLNRHDRFLAQDQELLDTAGPLLVHAVEHLAQIIREMPGPFTKLSYCVLFERFLNPDWTPADETELLAKMEKDGFKMTLEELRRYEMLGISVFASLAFQLPEQSALLYAEKMKTELPG